MTDTSNHLAAEERSSFGKGAARKLRAAGRIPAVIYGHGAEPRHVSLPGHETTLLVRKANQVIEIVIAGKQELTLVKDVQKDPVKQSIDHIDLVVVRAGEKVHVEVAVHVVGESFGGTQVLQDLAHVAVEAEATHIPESIEVSVEGATAGTRITAGELVLPAGATLLTDADAIVVAVSGVASDEDDSASAEA